MITSRCDFPIVELDNFLSPGCWVSYIRELSQLREVKELPANLFDVLLSLGEAPIA